MAREAYALITFLGDFTLSVLRLRSGPVALQLQAIGAQLERVGPSAIPIVALLSFLIGVVIAYQGAVQLRLYGANAFIVDLVAVTTVRELGPLLAGIIIAGRSGSAIAAEIATMKISNEIDALKTMGVDPVQVLVVPRIVALVIALPLLTVVADIASIGGGMAMAQAMLDVGPRDFLGRLPDVVSLETFAAGLVKTPVFAFLIGLVGCHQGMLAEQGAAGVGLRTTAAVVQAIFVIIVTDAVFSILFNLLGI
jgi:phospholipid/cholesterol/gamma-HCH transport system permease protein